MNGVVLRDGRADGDVDSYEFLPGQDYLEKYETVRELGRGKFGIVYEVIATTAGDGGEKRRYAAKHIKYDQILID